jgi:hypothetical protein
VEQRSAYTAEWRLLLQERFKGAADLLREEMDKEERILPPLVAQHFMQEEEEAQITVRLQ